MRTAANEQKKTSPPEAQVAESADPIQDTSTASNAALLRALQEREAKLEEREHEVKNRMQAIILDSSL